MNSYSLSIYSIKIHKYLKKDEECILSDFDNGKDLYGLIDDVLSSWKFDKRDDVKICKYNDTDKVFRIAMKDDENYWYNKSGRTISGIIESGVFGTEESVVDIQTGNTNYKKKKDEALLKPVYFMFYIPRDSTVGFLILEKIGNYGLFPS